MDVARLAAQLAAGIITAETIQQTYGDDVLTQVIAYSLGGIAGAAAGSAYDVVDDMLDGTLSDLFDW